MRVSVYRVVPWRPPGDDGDTPDPTPDQLRNSLTLTSSVKMRESEGPHDCRRSPIGRTRPVRGRPLAAGVPEGRSDWSGASGRGAGGVRGRPWSAGPPARRWHSLLRCGVARTVAARPLSSGGCGLLRGPHRDRAETPDHADTEGRDRRRTSECCCFYCGFEMGLSGAVSRIFGQANE
ncbi:hypothetical protein HPB47_009880 [Ixodes persulcatus]|uniref:Uncharacterized protein n=1 Tax=Ixodes persulcatus TaxID=34615 RepID=A0AC60P0M6_IXOPE|nr:hypothetical protein HPB47_009880 [Ixodes persulcatus]